MCKVWGKLIWPLSISELHMTEGRVRENDTDTSFETRFIIYILVYIFIYLYIYYQWCIYYLLIFYVYYCKIWYKDIVEMIPVVREFPNYYRKSLLKKPWIALLHHIHLCYFVILRGWIDDWNLATGLTGRSDSTMIYQHWLFFHS